MNRIAPRRSRLSLGGVFVGAASGSRFVPAALPRWGAALALVVILGCGDADRGAPRNERATAGAAAERAAPRPDPSPDSARRVHTPEPLQAHPADGQGHVRITPDDPVECGAWGRWTVDWIAGPDGLDPGDAAVLQVSPFWGWTPPQTVRPGAPGFTTVTARDGVALSIEDGLVPMTVIARVATGRLSPGDTLRFVYGDSASGGPGSLARADMYAEQFEELFIKTDGNGDGFFAAVPDQPTLRILPARPVRLAVAAPARVRPGAPFRVAVHALDARDNWAVLPEGPLRLTLRPLRDDSGDDPGPARDLEFLPTRTEPFAGAAAPARAAGSVAMPGAAGTVLVTQPGLYRLEASLAEPALRGANDVLLVDAAETFAGLLWGDLHAHSALSDGTGAPADLYAYAREVVGLDVCVVTDHDAHGLQPLAGAGWDAIRAATQAFHDPGRFVTLLGYEWTSWSWGHRNVYYPGDAGEVFAFSDEASDTPSELWARIAAFDGVTIPHHPGGGPVPVDWSEPSPEERETVVEICSIHGSSEALGVERGIYRPVPGASVRDALNAGHRLGILAAGDTHDGHPGRRTVGAPANGLAAFRGAGRTRAEILQALRDRRVYGTSGPRILLATDWGGHRPGSELAGAPAGPVTVRVVAPEPIEVVELIGPGGVVASAWGGGRRAVHELDAGFGPRSGDRADRARPSWRYVRVLLADGEVAWESPWWIGEAE